MSIRKEVAELMDSNKMYDVAQKVAYGHVLTSDEKEVYEISDAWAKEIGKTGHDKEHDIAAYITKVVNDEIYNAPDELLDSLFDRGSVGEFDETEYEKVAKNTLEAHEAAKGGTVDRSWIDFTALRPITRNRQIETDISYVDLRKNGFKAIALLTTYSKEALHNKLFFDVFDMVDAALVGGDQVIAAGGAVPTQAAWDAFSLYLIDRDANSVAVGLSKYAQAVARMTGYTQYMSEEMKNNFNRYGLVNFCNGVRIANISAAKKTGKGDLLIPDQRLFGIAGKIGNLDMKGDLHVYENMDNYNEKVIIQVKDFTYSIAINNIENCAKMVFTD